MSERQKILTVTVHDCEVQTFRSGGKGGQNQNKRDTGVRVIHHPSGARGESREERSQLQNKRAAFHRMVDTPHFRYWVSVQTGRVEATEKWLERMMRPENIRVETRVDGQWTTEDDRCSTR